MPRKKNRKRESIRDMTVVDIHDHVDASAIRKALVKVARVIFGLNEALNVNELTDERASR